MTMHKWMIALLSLALSCIAFATAPAVAAKPKTNAKPSAKAHSSKQAAAKPKPQATRANFAKAAPLVALPMLASPVPDEKVQADVAGLVHTGHMVCELGNAVTVTPDPQQATRFVVKMKKNTYHMTPVETTTGAVRLEDAQAGAMWLQLPHKSMLMNSKLGQRMADECQSDHQTAVAHRMKLDPPPSLLDVPALAKK